MCLSAQSEYFQLNISFFQTSISTIRCEWNFSGPMEKTMALHITQTVFVVNANLSQAEKENKNTKQIVSSFN